jgi:cation diffusion facilitator family transporter
MSAEGTRRAIVAAFIANLGIAISKFAAFLLTGSASMLAESIHSVADTGNQGLLFLGGKRARKPPTPEHPFGYGTERYFWAFIVALVLFTLGAMFAMYEGIQKLIDPHELDSPIWAFSVLGIALLLEGWSLRTARHEAKPSRGKKSWWSFIRSTKSPRGGTRSAASGSVCCSA